MKYLCLFLLCVSWANASFCQEKIVQEILVEGLKRTQKKTIYKLLETSVGDGLDSLIIHKDVTQLKRLPFVYHVDFTVVDLGKSTYRVVYNVEENFSIIPQVNFWSTTGRRLAYKIGVDDYNFLGRGIQLGAFYQQNGFDSYGVFFKDPFLFSKKFGLAFNYLDWSSEEPLYFEDNSANYKYQNKSYELMLLYQFDIKNQVAVGVNLFEENYHYISGFVSDYVPQALSVDKQLLKLLYTYDKLNYHYHYISGFKNQLYVQYVTTGNAYQDDFFITWNDAFYFKRVGDKGNWANRLRIGLSSNVNSPFAPFALDNNVNLRGVGILVDRGTGSIVWNSEYRYTAYDKKSWALQANIFTDIGSWRTPGGSLTDFISSENIGVYSGVGLRFITKKIFNAIFRIDYGYGLTRNASRGFVFGIGQYF